MGSMPEKNVKKSRDTVTLNSLLTIYLSVSTVKYNIDETV